MGCQGLSTSPPSSPLRLFPFHPHSSQSYLPSFPPFLTSLLHSFIYSFIPSFIPSFLLSLPSFLLPFLPSSLPPSLPYFIPSFAFVPSFPSFHSFLPPLTSFLPPLTSFLPPSHFLPSSSHFLPSSSHFLLPLPSFPLLGKYPSSYLIVCLKSGHIRPRQGTELCNFGLPSPLDLLNFSPLDFFLILQVRRAA